MRPSALVRIGDGWKNRTCEDTAGGERPMTEPVGDMHPFLEQWWRGKNLNVNHLHPYRPQFLKNGQAPLFRCNVIGKI